MVNFETLGSIMGGCLLVCSVSAQLVYTAPAFLPAHAVPAIAVIPATATVVSKAIILNLEHKT